MDKHHSKQPKRKATRLPNFDYSAGGAYFLTICTHNHSPLLSKVSTAVGEGLAPPAITLKPCGKIAEEQLLALETRYPNLDIDSYVIMPNHIHIILLLENKGGASPSPTISNIICAFKSLTSRICKERYKVEHIFQRSFMDHIIRNRKDYYAHKNYIINNPANWASDELHTDN